MQAGRRHLAQLYSATHQNVYSFHLSSRSGMGLKKAFMKALHSLLSFPRDPWSPNLKTTTIFVQGLISRLFLNQVAYILCIPNPTPVNWIGPDLGYQDLSKLMPRMIVTKLTAPQRPLHQNVGGKDMLFKANETHVEADDFRADSLKF
ncbi:hypothetical protein V2W45_1334669 [Cenococcum geophilum]